MRKADLKRLRCPKPRQISGSVNLDDALRVSCPQDPRWDYAIGLRTGRPGEMVLWVEVHPASSLHVGEVLAKLRWLKIWLAGHAPELGRMPGRFHWVATGGIAFTRGSPQARRIAQQGVSFPVKLLDVTA